MVRASRASKPPFRRTVVIALDIAAYSKNDASHDAGHDAVHRTVLRAMSAGLFDAVSDKAGHSEAGESERDASLTRWLTQVRALYAEPAVPARENMCGLLRWVEELRQVLAEYRVRGAADGPRTAGTSTALASAATAFLTPPLPARGLRSAGLRICAGPTLRPHNPAPGLSGGPPGTSSDLAATSADMCAADGQGPGRASSLDATPPRTRALVSAARARPAAWGTRDARRRRRRALRHSGRCGRSSRCHGASPAKGGAFCPLTTDQRGPKRRRDGSQPPPDGPRQSSSPPAGGCGVDDIPGGHKCHPPTGVAPVPSTADDGAGTGSTTASRPATKTPAVLCGLNTPRMFTQIPETM